MNRRAVTAALGVLAFIGAVGCGVSSQDEPQPIEDSSIQQPPATPSVESEPGPTPSVTSPSPSPSSAPPDRPSRASVTSTPAQPTPAG